jgi:hypothetical protein
MGFGYHQARAAGLGGIRESRSPRQVNLHIKDAKANRNAVQYLRDKAKDPNWELLIRFRAAEGRCAEEIESEVYWIDRYARARTKGYSLAYRLRYHWPY